VRADWDGALVQLLCGGPLALQALALKTLVDIRLLGVGGIQQLLVHASALATKARAPLGVHHGVVASSTWLALLHHGPVRVHRDRLESQIRLRCPLP